MGKRRRCKVRETKMPIASATANQSASTGATSKRDSGRWLSRFIALWKMIPGVVIALPTVVQYFLGISVSSPVPAFEGRPYSVPFDLKNDSFLPVEMVQWSCDMINVPFPGAAHNLNVGLKHTETVWIWPGRSRTAHCETSYLLADEMPDFPRRQLSLSVDFYPFPWIGCRTHRAVFEAIVDPFTHRFSRWTPM